MVRCIRAIMAVASSPHFSRCYAMENHGHKLVCIGVSTSLAQPRPADSLIFRQWVGTNYERAQEVAGRFRRVPVSQKIRELRVMLTHRQAREGMGMVTGWRLTDADRWCMTYDSRRPVRQGQVENAACRCVDTCAQSTVWPAWPRRSSRPADRSPMSVTEVHDVDGLLRVEDLVVEVIPAPAEKQTADITEELARRATSRLGYVLDQRQGTINFVREQVSGRRPVAAPPQQCGFDLRNGNW